MRLLLAIIAILLPCYAWAGEYWDFSTADMQQKARTELSANAGLRIVRCTQEQYAVQEHVAESYLKCGQYGPCKWITEGWHDLTGCYSLEAARRFRDDEMAYRNPPPAPYVIEPVQVVE